LVFFRGDYPQTLTRPFFLLPKSKAPAVFARRRSLCLWPNRHTIFTELS
jgi:hypothetical protein